MAYVIAFGFFALAVLARVLFDPWVDNRLLLSFIAVTFSALYGGRWPALAVIALSVPVEYLLRGFLADGGTPLTAGALALFIVPGLAVVVLLDGPWSVNRRRDGKLGEASERRRALDIETTHGMPSCAAASFPAAERRLEKARILIEGAPTPICWTSDPEGREIRCNRAYRDMLGVTRSGAPDPQNRNFFASRLCRDGGELVFDNLPLRRCLATGQAITSEELEVVRADGTRVSIIASATPLASENRTRGAICVLFDVTARRNAEAVRTQAERRKDEFLAMLAHELRNPLAPIRNALEILQQETGDARRLPWALKLIERQLHQLTRITDDLLELARIVRGQIVLQQESLDLRAVVARAVETSRPVVEARRHTLRVDVPHEATWINGDIARLAQAISNLLNNAARYTPEGGAIFVTCRAADGTAELRVRDTGRGIEPTLLPRIFESFVKGERNFARSDGGLGIGLTIAKRIAELHNGALTAHSAGLNQGAEFVLTLPLTQRVAPPEDNMRRATADYPRRRVFIVDDNQDVADSVAVLLKLRGHVAEQHYAGEGAIEKAEAFEPNVVILDLGLPGLDGYGLARLFRAHPRLHSCALLAMSGFGQTADLQRSAAAGFDCHLLKPVDPPLLFELVEGRPAAAFAPAPGFAALSKEAQGQSPAVR